MVLTWIVPELGNANFTDTFSKMIKNYIYDQWSFTTGNLAKPASPTGQSNLIEFRRGFPSDLKSLSVTVVQGRTQVREYMQFGQKIQSMQTQVIVTLRVQTLNQDDPDDVLALMEDELVRICGQYQQSAQVSGDMRGVKDLIYEAGERQYLPNDTWDKSEYASMHSILVWYQLSDVQ